MAVQFIDVESAVCELLESVAPTFTVTGENDPLPLIQVNRTGGTRTPLEDRAVVTVVCVADTRPDSMQLDREVSAALSDARGVRTSFGLIDKIREDASPMPLPFPGVADHREITSTWVVISRLQDID